MLKQLMYFLLLYDFNNYILIYAILLILYFNISSYVNDAE